MTRLPQPGKDSGTWGNILNDYLSRSHTTDGSLKDNTVGSAQLQAGAITESHLASPISQDKIAGLEDALAGKATSEQGALADTAVQPGAAEALIAGKLGTGGALDEALSSTYAARSAWIVPAPTGNATTDTANINAAISGAGTRPIVLQGGTYKSNGGHVLGRPMRISGSARTKYNQGGGTSIRLADGANANLFTITGQNVTIHDLGLTGNSANQTGTSHGIVTLSGSSANWFHFERLWIEDFLSDGIYLSASGSLSGTIRAVESRLHGGHGITIESGAADVMIAQTYLSQCGLSGLYVNAASVSCTDCHVWGNGTLGTATDNNGIVQPSTATGRMRVIGCYVESNSGYGLRLRGAANVIFGTHIWKNGMAGIYAYGNTNLSITGSAIHSNNTTSASGGSGAGINLQNCTACTVSGNVMYNTAGTGHQRYGYYESGDTCTGCVFIGNTSRAVDHQDGNWVIASLSSPTIPASPELFNAA